MKTHKDLEVWKNSIAFVTDIYNITSKFPKNELYGLISQINRSAVSIPSNIAEGAARNHHKEFIQFLYISLGSLSEIETQLIISNNLGLITQEILNSLDDKMKTIRNQLNGMIKYLKEKQ